MDDITVDGTEQSSFSMEGFDGLLTNAVPEEVKDFFETELTAM